MNTQKIGYTFDESGIEALRTFKTWNIVRASIADDSIADYITASHLDDVAGDSGDQELRQYAEDCLKVLRPALAEKLFKKVGFEKEFKAAVDVYMRMPGALFLEYDFKNQPDSDTYTQLRYNYFDSAWDVIFFDEDGEDCRVTFRSIYAIKHGTEGIVEQLMAS